MEQRDRTQLLAFAERLHRATVAGRIVWARDTVPCERLELWAAEAGHLRVSLVNIFDEGVLRLCVTHPDLNMTKRIDSARDGELAALARAVMGRIVESNEERKRADEREFDRCLAVFSFGGSC